MVEEGEEPDEVLKVRSAAGGGNLLLSPAQRSCPNVADFTPAEFQRAWEPTDTMASSVASCSCANLVPGLLCKHFLYYKQRLNERAGGGGQRGVGEEEFYTIYITKFLWQDLAWVN